MGYFYFVGLFILSVAVGFQYGAVNGFIALGAGMMVFSIIAAIFQNVLGYIKAKR